MPEQLLPSAAPTVIPPRVLVGPDLFNPPAPQGWLTVTPSFTLSGEYNDNVHLSSSRDRRSDGIFGLSPGVTLAVQRPGFRLLGGVTTSGQVYVPESGLSDFGKQEQFFTDLFYQVTPRLTFTLSDRFTYSKDSNALTSGGISVGRTDAWDNTLTPQLQWQAAPNTGFTLLGSYTTLRFPGSGSGQGGVSATGEENSDTYRVGLTMSQRLTARLTGTLGLNVAYFDFQREKPATSYTPTLGASYDITPTLRATVSGGPSIVQRDGDTTLRPFVTAVLTQTFKSGTLVAGYSNAVVAEAVGLSDAQTIYASLGWTITRGLRLELTPNYVIVNTGLSGNSQSASSSQKVDILTVNVVAKYQIARNISLIGSYTLFRQRTNGTTGITTGDTDQNRVFLGLQYAFPINFY